MAGRRFTANRPAVRRSSGQEPPIVSLGDGPRAIPGRATSPLHGTARSPFPTASQRRGATAGLGGPLGLAAIVVPLAAGGFQIERQVLHVQAELAQGVLNQERMRRRRFVLSTTRANTGATAGVARPETARWRRPGPAFRGGCRRSRASRCVFPGSWCDSKGMSWTQG